MSPTPRSSRTSRPSSGWLAAALLLASGCAGDDGTGAGAPYDPLSPRVPAETADAAALERLSDWRGLPVLGDGLYLQQSSFDRMTGEAAPVSFVDRGNRDMNNFVCASADATLAPNQLVPLRFDLASCPENYVRGVVLSRFEGAGVMVRLWMTASSLSGAPADEEMLRIYADDDPLPVVQLPLASFLDGSAGEIFAPPFGAGSSHWGAWYYPVAFGSKLVVTLDRLGPLDLYYHQTDVIGDDEPRAAAPSRLALRDDAAALLGDVAAPGAGAASLFGPTTVLTAPGTTTLADLSGPATIAELSIDIADDVRASLADATLRIRWDQAAEPAVAVPLFELFAAADAVPGEGHALRSTRAGGTTRLALRLPMPFAERALFELERAAGPDAPLQIELRGHPGVPAAPWGRLQVERHETVGPTASTHHPLASRSQAGKLVGVCLMLEGHAIAEPSAFAAAFNFLEGDEEGLVDGRGAMPGTGTEDYLDSAFYFAAGAFHTPFAQAWGIAQDAGAGLDAGRVSACRWHVLTAAVDYGEQLELSLEIGPGDPSVADRYRTLAFVYEAD